MLLVFLGPPGAGKGTQASRLSAKHGIAKVSTGDMLREAVAAKTELGDRVRTIMDEGRLVDDETMGEVVRERLMHADVAAGAILDGYPRTRRQAEQFDALLQSTGRSGVDLVLLLDVPEAALVQRLSKRRACPQCGANYHLEFHPPMAAGICDRCGAGLVQRDDDREQVVLDRLRVYRELTEPIAEYYEQQGLLQRVDGTGKIDEVFRRVDGALTRAVRS